jgi:hypothetical protein
MRERRSSGITSRRRTDCFDVARRYHVSELGRRAGVSGDQRPTGIRAGDLPPPRTRSAGCGPASRGSSGVSRTRANLRRLHVHVGSIEEATVLLDDRSNGPLCQKRSSGSRVGWPALARPTTSPAHGAAVRRGPRWPRGSSSGDDRNLATALELLATVSGAGRSGRCCSRTPGWRSPARLATVPWRERVVCRHRAPQARHRVRSG